MNQNNMTNPFKMTIEFSKKIGKSVKNNSVREKHVLYSNTRDFGNLIDKLKHELYGNKKDQWVITQSLIK